VTDDGHLVMERQYRHPLSRVFLEIPAGKLEVGEAPLECAKRELREETGFEAGHWQYLGVIHPCIGYADERIEIFLARDLRYEGRKLDQGEFLDVAQIPVAEVFAAAHQGCITDGKTLSALFLAQRTLHDLPLNASVVGGGV
jgi:ADP-ribose pyrophosphatase